jgi:hypothetical protein
MLGVRLPVDLIRKVDAWAEDEGGIPSRSEAIRQLLNYGLVAAKKTPYGVVKSGDSRLSGPQIRAARALIKWTAADLARRASLGVNTIGRAELSDGMTGLTIANELAIRRALEAAGIEFIDENGGGPGVRLGKPLSKKT